MVAIIRRATLIVIATGLVSATPALGAPLGRVTEFPVTVGTDPLAITAGPDGNLWFTENLGNRIGRVTPDGTVSEFFVYVSNARPSGITAGPDGAVWFTLNGGNRIGARRPDRQDLLDEASDEAGRASGDHARS